MSEASWSGRRSLGAVARAAGVLRGLAAAAVACGCAATGTPLAAPSFDAAARGAAPAPASELATARLSTLAVNLDDGLSADEAAVLAVIGNPELRAERARRGLATAQLVEAGVLPNPQLAAQVSWPSFGNTAGASRALGAEVAFELSALVPRANALRAADLSGQAVALDVAWREWQTALTARAAWFRTESLGREVVVAKDAEAELARSLEVLERALAEGQATALEVSAARTALDQARIDRLGLDEERTRAGLGLRRALGLAPEAPLTLEAPSPPEPWLGVPALSELTRGLEDRRLDLMAFRRGLDSQDERVRAAVLSGFPRLSVGLGAANDTTGVGTVGLSLTADLPLFDRGQGRVAVARAERSRLADEYAARLFAARADLARGTAELAAARAALEATEASLPGLERLAAIYQGAVRERLADVLVGYQVLHSLAARRLEALRRRRELSGLFVSIELASGRYLGRGHAEKAQP